MRSLTWLLVSSLLALPGTLTAQGPSDVVERERAPAPAGRAAPRPASRTPAPRAPSARNKTTLPASTPSLVVIESGLGSVAADAVRSSLQRLFAVRVLTMRDVTARDTRPHALLTIARDHDGSLSAMYWQSSGEVDVFTAAAPNGPLALQTAAVTLATTVLERHIGELRLPAGGGVHPATATDAATASLDRMVSAHTLYVALSRLGLVHRRTVELKIEDF